MNLWCVAATHPRNKRQVAWIGAGFGGFEQVFAFVKFHHDPRITTEISIAAQSHSCLEAANE